MLSNLAILTHHLLERKLSSRLHSGAVSGTCCKIIKMQWQYAHVLVYLIYSSHSHVILTGLSLLIFSRYYPVKEHQIYQILWHDYFISNTARCLMSWSRKVPLVMLLHETGNLVSSLFYSNAHSDDKERDEKRVGLQKEIEKSNLAKENPDPSTVLSKAQDIAKPFNCLRLKDVRRAVDDYLRKESCKRDLVTVRDLLKALKKDSGKRDVLPKISAITAICDRALPYCLFGDHLSLLGRLESLEDDEAMREIDNEYEKHLNVFELHLVSVCISLIRKSFIEQTISV